MTKIEEGYTYNLKNGIDYAPGTKTSIQHYDVPPWRYRCANPECRSSSVEVRQKIGDHKEYVEYIRGFGRSYPRIHDYKCTVCGAQFDKVYDMKLEKYTLLDI